jgi:hypothetical protein
MSHRTPRPRLTHTRVAPPLGSPTARRTPPHTTTPRNEPTVVDGALAEEDPWSTDAEEEKNRLPKKAIGWITASACCHFFATEFCRAAAFTLFTTRFGAGFFLPSALACVPVLALFLMKLYNWLLARSGPRTTLITSILSCLGVVLLCAAGTLSSSPNVAAASTLALFVSREATVTFLTSQFWSFLGSIVVADEAKKIFGPLTGITSCASVVSGLLVSYSAPSHSAQFLLYVAAGAWAAAAFCADEAYRATPPNLSKTWEALRAQNHSSGSGAAAGAGSGSTARLASGSAAGDSSAMPLLDVSDGGIPRPPRRAPAGAVAGVAGVARGSWGLRAPANRLFRRMGRVLQTGLGLENLALAPVLPAIFCCTLLMQCTATWLSLALQVGDIVT